MPQMFVSVSLLGSVLQMNQDSEYMDPGQSSRRYRSCWSTVRTLTSTAMSSIHESPLCRMLLRRIHGLMDPTASLLQTSSQTWFTRCKRMNCGARLEGLLKVGIPMSSWSSETSQTTALQESQQQATIIILPDSHPVVLRNLISSHSIAVCSVPPCF